MGLQPNNQHDLRDEDRVGVAGMAPRQIAAIPAVPIQQEGDGGRREGHGVAPFRMVMEWIHYSIS